MVLIQQFCHRVGWCCGIIHLIKQIRIEYCSRPLADQPGKTCQDVGALNKYMDKVHADPIRKEFHKAYKRNHSRVRVGSMTQTEFLEWSDEARKKRDQCIAGAMSKDEFMEWVNNDRRYAKRH